MKKVPLLPNVITAFGLSCGLFVIFKVALLDRGSIDCSVLKGMVAILLLAALADILDGAVARAMKAESDFGGVFDSLADAITFGVAPSLILLKTVWLGPEEEISFLVTMSAMVYSVCGVLRLVRFSVANIESKEDEVLFAAHQKNFTGLPIPAAAAAILSANLLFCSRELLHVWSPSPEAKMWIMTVAATLIGYLMISRWKFPSLKRLRVRVASFQTVFLTVLAAVCVFYGILYFFSVIFFVFAWGYIIVALSLSIIRMLTGRTIKTLEEFDPDPDELSDD